jgi:hypothetical protein
MRKHLSGRPGLSRIVADYLPALHHEFYSLELGNVFQGITGNGDDVRKLPFFD